MAKNKFALGAIIGAAAGAVAGILTAPKSGKETRADIKDRAEDLKNQATDQVDSVRKRGEEVIEKARKEVGKK